MSCLEPSGAGSNEEQDDPETKHLLRQITFSRVPYKKVTMASRS